LGTKPDEDEGNSTLFLRASTDETKAFFSRSNVQAFLRLYFSQVAPDKDCCNNLALLRFHFRSVEGGRQAALPFLLKANFRCAMPLNLVGR